VGRDRGDPWHTALDTLRLTAVTTAWSLTWTGAFIHQASIVGPKEPGYWGLLVSIGVVVVGTVVVWVSSRPGSRPRFRDQPVPGE
jgi:hypothetical protein